MSFWLSYQKAFPVKPYQFHIFELWREAFKMGRQAWLSLIAADIILIIVSHSPVWMPVLGQMFPFLREFQIHPAWLDQLPLLKNFTDISKFLLPLLFTFFITMPIYLGINLLTLRLVYKRPASLKQTLTHYLGFFWWSNLLSLLIISGLVVVPIFMVARQLMIHAATPIYLTQFYAGMSVLAITVIALLIMLSMVLQLMFAARVNISDAIKMSWKAVSMNFWRITGMVLLLYLVQNIGYRTWYLSDIFLMPPSYFAWALLYKRIFGEQGLVE